MKFSELLRICDNKYGKPKLDTADLKGPFNDLMKKYPNPNDLIRLKRLDVLNTKRLAKAAEILPGWGVQQIDWIIGLNYGCVGLIDAETPQENNFAYSKENLDVMRSHCLGHNAELLRDSAYKVEYEERIDRLNKAYETTTVCLSSLEDISSMYVCSILGLRGKIARAIAEHVSGEEKIYWFRLGFENSTTNSIMISQIMKNKPKDIETLVQSWFDVLGSCEGLKKCDPKNIKYWLKEAYQANQKSRCALREIDEEKAEAFKILVGFLAQETAQVKETERDKQIWLKLAIKFLEDGLKFSKEPKQIGFGYGKLVDAKYALVEVVDDVKRKVDLLKSASSDADLSVKYLKSLNPSHTAMVRLNSGKVALELWALTGNDEDRNRAISNYQDFLNYFNKNPEPRLIKTQIAIERVICDLEKERSNPKEKNKKRSSKNRKSEPYKRKSGRIRLEDYD